MQYEELDLDEQRQDGFHIRFRRSFVGKKGRKCMGAPTIFHGDVIVCDAPGRDMTEARKWLKKFRACWQAGYKAGFDAAIAAKG